MDDWSQFPVADTAEAEQPASAGSTTAASPTVPDGWHIETIPDQNGVQRRYAVSPDSKSSIAIDGTGVGPAAPAATAAAPADTAAPVTSGEQEDWSQFPAVAPKEHTWLDELGIAGRAAVKGVDNIAQMMAAGGGPLKAGVDLAHALGVDPTSLLDRAGVAAPQTDNEMLASKAIEGAATAAPFAAVGGPVLPVLLGGAASSAAGEDARQLGYGPGVQLAASLGAGGLTMLPRAGLDAVRSLATKHAQDYAALAERLGVTPTPATTGGVGAQATQMALGNIPGGMHALQPAVEAETGGLQSAAQRTAESIGTISTPEAAGTKLARGAAAYERATSSKGGALYRQRDALMSGPGAPVSMDKTRQAFADFKAGFPTSPALADLIEHPAMRRLENAIPGKMPTDPDAGIMTLGEATEALSHARSVLRNLYARSQATPGVIKQIKAIEQALEDDVMNAAKAADQAAGRAAGPGSAQQAQIDADAYWASRSKALNGSLKTARASSADPLKVSGQKVYEEVSALMGRKGGNLAKLRDIWFRLPQGARRTFAATKLDDMGRATSGAQSDLGTNWSFNTFLTNFDKMSPQARRIVFGANAEPQIKDIAAYANRLRQLGWTRNFSNTAKNLFAGAILSTIGGALWHGDLSGAMEAAGSVPLAYGGAKLFLATPAMRNWTKSAMRVALTENPAVQQKGSRYLLSQLGTIAQADPVISAPARALQDHLSWAFSHPPMAAVAQDKKDRK
jgi:hypothetical protein